jgi:hypothetical protein
MVCRSEGLVFHACTSENGLSGVVSRVDTTDVWSKLSGTRKKYLIGRANL